MANPNCSDETKLEYAAGYATFLLLKNQNSGEWEFPNAHVTIGQTFLEAQNSIIQNNFSEALKLE